MPALRATQSAYVAQHINLSQSSAFLASVAATTLQYSELTANQSGTAAATIAVWYASLSLAVTSALLSLLAAVLATYPQYVHGP